MVYACHPLMVTVQGIESASIPCTRQRLNLPPAANENLRVKSEWMTPAEALQTVQRIKRRLQRENMRDYALFMSAHKRRIWDEVQVCEQCLLWKYFR